MNPKLDIIRFCQDRRILGFGLWPRQEVILRAAYGLPMPAHLLPLYHKMAETDRPYEPRVYRQVVLVVGRQSGKTRMTRASTAYDAEILDFPQYLPETEYAQCTVVATSQIQARNVFLSTLARECVASPIIGRHLVEYDNRPAAGIEKSTKDQLVFQNRSIIRAIPCNARAGLGYTCWKLVLDEIAKYAHETGSVRADQEVMRALQPSMRVFWNRGIGSIWMISSPQAKEGIFWGAYDDRDNRRDWQLTMRCPSWDMDPAWDWAQWRALQEADPDGFRLEYGAEFCEQIEGVFLLEEVNAVLSDRGELEPDPNRVYWGRLDPAFVHDTFGLGIGHNEGDFTRVDWLQAMKPPKGGAVDLHEVADLVEAKHKKYDVRKWRTDQYAGEPIAQVLRARKIPVEVEPWTSGYKRKIYSTFTSQVKSRHFDAPDIPQLRREMIRLQRRLSASGIVTVGHPKGESETDDLADICAGLSHDCATRKARPRGGWESFAAP